MNTAKYCIELTAESTQPIHSASYCAELKAREFENAEINKDALQNVIKSSLEGGQHQLSSLQRRIDGNVSATITKS